MSLFYVFQHIFPKFLTEKAKFLTELLPNIKINPIFAAKTNLS